MLGRRGATPATVDGMAAAPRTYNPTPGTVVTAPALWSVRERNAAILATVPRTDRRQQLPRARLGTSRLTTALLPSKLPLFGYKIRHDGQAAARTVKAAAYSTVRRTTLPHVAE
jgi:hypothetical protein